MFHNVGKKIKSLAEFLCVFGIIVCVVIACILAGTGMILFGVIVAVAGSLAFILASMLLYGFGELVDCARRIADAQEEPSRGIAPPPHAGWTCSSCGTQNLLGDAVCKKCGKS